jgi:hypothetical protein
MNINNIILVIIGKSSSKFHFILKSGFGKDRKLTPCLPALRDGIARCLTKLRHGDAHLSLTKRGELLIYFLFFIPSLLPVFFLLATDYCLLTTF